MKLNMQFLDDQFLTLHELNKNACLLPDRQGSLSLRNVEKQTSSRLYTSTWTCSLSHTADLSVLKKKSANKLNEISTWELEDAVRITNIQKKLTTVSCYLTAQSHHCIWKMHLQLAVEISYQATDEWRWNLSGRLKSSQQSFVQSHISRLEYQEVSIILLSTRRRWVLKGNFS